MQFKARIKSVTQYPIRGTRLFPIQFLTDSSKSLHVPDQLTNSSFTKVNNSHSLLLQDQQEMSRLNNRHSTDFTASRPTFTRLSLDQVNKNRSVDQDESNQRNLSDRNHNLEAVNEPKMEKYIELKNSNIAVQQQNVDVQHLSAFRELHIQRIIDNQSKKIKLVESQKGSPRKESQQEQATEVNDFLSESRRNILGDSSKNVEQVLQNQFKQKYEALKKDHLQMSNNLHSLQSEKLKLKQEYEQKRRLDANTIVLFGEKVEQQEKKILTLQQALKINRNINESLMRKQREMKNLVNKRMEELKTQIEQEERDKREEISGKYEKQIFQLKLKLIDQANQYEQAYKLKQQTQIQNVMEKNALLNEISILKNQGLELFLELEIVKTQLSAKYNETNDIIVQNSALKLENMHINDEIAKLIEEIIRIDGQNLRIDQENFRLSCENQRNISSFQDQMEFIKRRCDMIENEKQGLIDVLQDKQSLIAQLNLTKNYAILQILELKNQIKKQKEIQIVKKEEDKQEKEKMNETIKCLKEEIEMTKGTIKKLQNSINEVNLLENDDIETVRIENDQLKMELYNLERQKKQLQIEKHQLVLDNVRLQNSLSAQSKELIDLQNLVSQNQFHQSERDKIIKQREQEISYRANELKQVQQQYLELIEGELKKIQSINEENEDDFFEIPDELINNPLKLSLGFVQQSSPRLSSRKDSHSPSQENSSQSKEQYELEINELTIKIEELTFVNDALKKKVEELNELQQNSNIIILQQIKSFEQNLEKTLQQKSEIDLFNKELSSRVDELTEKCIVYECKMSWLEENYKELESNLLQTQEELIRSQFQYINMKLMRIDEDKDGQEDDKRFQDHPKNQEMDQCLRLIYQEEPIDSEDSQRVNQKNESNKCLKCENEQQLSYQSCQSQKNEFQIIQEKQDEIEKEKEIEIIKIRSKEDEKKSQQQDIGDKIVETCQKTDKQQEKEDIEIKIQINQVQSQSQSQDQKQYPLINILLVQSEQSEELNEQTVNNLKINIITVLSEDQCSSNEQTEEKLEEKEQLEQKNQLKMEFEQKLGQKQYSTVSILAEFIEMAIKGAQNVLQGGYYQVQQLDDQNIN